MRDNDLVSEIKSALSGFDLVESRLETLQVKGVSIIRHVRDVDYWGLPYGTVIVARGKGKGSPLTNIWANKDRVNDGFREYVGSDDSIVSGSAKPAIYHVGKQGTQFSVRDENGKEIYKAKDEISALEWLNGHARRRSEASGAGRVSEEQGFREPPEDMHKATGPELRTYGAANRKLVDIFIWDDNSDKKTYGYGYDRNGRQSSFRKADKVEEANANKFAIVRAIPGLIQPVIREQFRFIPQHEQNALTVRWGS